jgi:molecular chaperone GrpE
MPEPTLHSDEYERREPGLPEPEQREPEQREPAQREPEPENREPGREAGALEAQLRQAQAKLVEQREEMMRALAETENIRKRLQAEAATAQKFALERFAGTLLPVLDSLEAALGAENASAEAMRSGVELTLKQMKAVLERASIVEINPSRGERFDPHRHQAMAAVEAEAEPNTVVTVMQTGYLLHERVLRPALVTVARKKVENSAANPISDTSLDSGT